MSKYTLAELEPCIVQWAYDMELILFANAPKQRLKLISEAGELSDAILKNDIPEIKDALGDMFVVLVILAHQTNYKLHLANLLRWSDDTYSSDHGVLINEIIQHAYLNGLYTAMNTLYYLSESLGFSLSECANLAWNEIKDRKGNTVNGTFIKIID